MFAGEIDITAVLYSTYSSFTTDHLMWKNHVNMLDPEEGNDKKIIYLQVRQRQGSLLHGVRWGGGGGV
jgi:hypothetical protein